MIEGSFLASIDLLELFGPLVADHSRVGHSVFGSEEDIERFERVKSIVQVRSGSNRNFQHDARDSIHIATSIRYGYDGFLTSDERLISRDAQFTYEFNFRILKIDAAIAQVNRLIEDVERRETLRQTRRNN